MTFHPYQHIERWGTPEVRGIEQCGTCCIFPKLDGCNTSVWCDLDGVLYCGSRHTNLGMADTPGFRGFKEYVHQHTGLREFFKANPYAYLYGEWLVPHSLKTYEDTAWNKFYVFDMAFHGPDGPVYVSYDAYAPDMEKYHIDYIPCIAKIERPTQEQLEALLQNNTYLIQQGKGVGEGIVIKRYGFINEHNRTVWAKMITSEFKYKHIASFGPPTLKGGEIVETAIVDKFVTEAMVDKVIHSLPCPWKPEYVPRLLETVFYTLVTEETWNILHKFKKHQTINFRTLRELTISKLKQLKPDLFRKGQ